MKNELIKLLNTFGYPELLQGSLASDEVYPESFFTFWNSETPAGSHYDNEPNYYVWDFDVNFYSADPALVNTVPETALELLKQNGFVPVGKDYDLPTDEPTHTGRGFNVLYRENKQLELGGS